MFKARSGSLGSGSAIPVERIIKKETDVEAAMANSDIDNLEDARKLARDLRQKTRAQAQQIIAWRRAYKMQESLVARLQREKAHQLKILSAKLLLFESRLIRKQKEISSMLTLRENIIHRQQRIIETLTNRLIDNGLEVPQSELAELETTLPDLDSLNDSDSAVVMEDIDSDSNVTIPKFRTGNSVMRSISDAIDPSLKYTSMRRNNGFLRRPEILETVYSVEEDADNENQNSDNTNDANKKRDAFAARGKSTYNVEETEENNAGQKEGKNANSMEKTEESEDDKKTSQVKTYNRVMSNHRSVTKPKDVKYKRINKAKSKSLEELRGRLKNWVEQGTKLTGITLEHSQSCA
ncbi:uncharacterized protein LOC123009552 isoform X1 [Tribolium madens]|uniref:uncharacterized protein LOC123009552 isoform X1 n=1 Tax=Tribolium madens TaxID=41895 RepID=UPI001CF725B3|nr:uncharacterized protein LOC123009552 isoform X1 [Tribolium madens]